MYLKCAHLAHWDILPNAFVICLDYVEKNNIDAELAKKAETGDVSAIETLETRKQERIVKDLRNKLFGI